MPTLTPAGQQAVSAIAQRHGFSTDAVTSMLHSVWLGNGTMAQFSHPEFGGSGQWMAGGMTMVSDMFNNYLKGRVDGLCAELSQLLANQPGTWAAPGSFQSQSQGGFSSQGGWMPSGPSTLFEAPPPGSGGNFWPAELQHPNSVGAQNSMRYAVFNQARRLVVELNGQVTVYDTLDHQIGGASQQSGSGLPSFSSQYGTVELSRLPIVSVNGQPPVPPAPAPVPAAPSFVPAPPAMAWATPAAAPTGGADPAEIMGLIEKLGDLHARGLLTAEEFGAKKTELLGRL